MFKLDLENAEEPDQIATIHWIIEKARVVSTTLLNSFTSFNFFFFLVESLGFSMYKIISSANKDTFTSFFMIWMLYISFPCPNVLARTSRTTLNRNVETEQLCFILSLSGKAFNLSPLSMI